MKHTIALCAVLLLHGCASDRAYVEPTGPEVARLTGKFVRDSISDWERYEIRGVDGLTTPRPFAGEAAEVTVAVAPGARRIFVRFEYNRTRSGQLFRGPGKPTEAYYILEAQFQSGREYQANGKVGAQFTEVWIEERGTGQTVSSRVACQPRPASAAPAICSKPSPQGTPSQ